MTLPFDVSGLKEYVDEIRNFKTNLIQFDVERVKRNSTKRFAMEMTEMVRQILLSHPDINAPATKGPYESGPGPSISTEDAWVVRRVGNDYIARPHPQVEQRAISLNYGMGRIEPTGDGPLRWYVDGVPRFAEYIPADVSHDATYYWQTAFNRISTSDKIDKIASSELKKEAARAFNKPTNVIDRS